jgi:hypothetical protein
MSGGSVFNDGSIVAIWMSRGQEDGYSWNIYGQIFQFTGECYSFSAMYGRLDSNQVTFTSLPNDTVKITILSTKGGLQDNNSSVLDDVKFYPVTDIYYKTTVTTSDSFYYVNSKGDMPCRVDITICYTSCKTCSTVGDDLNHKCTACLNSDDYYPISDNLTNCVKKTDILPGYFFDNTDMEFKPCYDRCASCTAAGSPDFHFCIDCADGYYPLSDKTSQCFKSTETVSNYFFDSTQFTPCDVSCGSCDKSATACTTCNTTGGYFSVPTTPGDCIQLVDIPKGYYFDDTLKQIKKCYDSCDTCNGDGTNDVQMCTACKDGYIFVDGRPSNCYSTTNPMEGYYIQGNVMLPCYKTCKYCSGAGTVKNPNCTECKPGLSCGPCVQIIYNDECISSCPDPLLFDPIAFTCYSCKDRNQVKFGNDCVDKCPNNYMVYKNVCYTCSFNGQVGYQGSCIDSCPTGYQITNGICVQDPITITNSTVTTATNSITDNIDTTGSTATALTTHLTPSNIDTTQCTPSTCKNDGVCSIKYNIISCDCKPLYTGTFCQILNNAQNLGTILGILNFIFRSVS